MGPLPGNWLAARIADLTPDLQALLSWGSTVMSIHSWQSFSVSFFHVSLGLPAPPPPPPLPSIYISHAVLTAPLERSTSQTSEAFSLSKWGWGPQALPVAPLTLPWPHPLAWYWRSVWKLEICLNTGDLSDNGPIIALQVHLDQWLSFNGMEHGAPCTQGLYTWPWVL